MSVIKAENRLSLLQICHCRNYRIRQTWSTGIFFLDEAAWKLQEQAAFLNFEGAKRVSVSEITLEDAVVISDDGEILDTPVWRFPLGEDEDERNFQRQIILGVDAVTGELIWKERGEYTVSRSFGRRLKKSIFPRKGEEEYIDIW